MGNELPPLSFSSYISPESFRGLRGGGQIFYITKCPGLIFLKVSRFQGLKVSKFQGFKVSRFKVRPYYTFQGSGSLSFKVSISAFQGFKVRGT